jgi:hypothetical protein
MLQHPDGHLGARAQTELGEHVGHVRLGGALGDDQLLGNFAVGAAVGDQHRDLPCPVR